MENQNNKIETPPTKDRVTILLWEWVKAIAVVAFIVVVSIKICLSPATLNVDFPTLLSLALALFSVALSAIFYFKATETSNAFYDNTYKYTQDIAQLLVKIESGFGEKLTKIDEGYSSVRNYLQTAMSSHSNVGGNEEKLKAELQEVKRVKEERDNIILELMETSQLKEDEKTEITAKLRSKDDELNNARRQIDRLNREIMKQGMEVVTNDRVARYLTEHFIKEVGASNIDGFSDDELSMVFQAYSEKFNPLFIGEIKEKGYYDGVLTPRGVKLVRSIVNKLIDIA